MLQEVEEIALAAGRVIMRHHAGPRTATEKADRSPVTLADLEADALIVSALKRLAPEIPCVSEEGGIPDFSTRKDWRTFWLVDPLDGTKEFVKGGGDFTVNIALIEGTAPVLGVVYAPVSGLLYYARKSEGAWRKAREGRPERLSVAPRNDPEGWVVVESLSHPSPELETYLKGRKVKARIKAGSSIKFCRVAEGAADVYPRFGPTSEWDTAAGDAVYRYSGAKGERPSPLVYNKPTMRNGSFVIGG